MQNSAAAPSAIMNAIMKDIIMHRASIVMENKTENDYSIVLKGRIRPFFNKIFS